MNRYDDDYLAALELAEQAMPADPRELLKREEDLAEVVAKVTDADGNPVQGATDMRRVRGDDEWESYVTLYSTLDGMPSRVLAGMVPKKLRQRWPEVSQVPEILWGKPCFTRKPITKYQPGNLPCMLGVDYEDREFILSVGLGGVPCRKHNFRTEFAVRQHMMHKHSDEWAAIESAIARRDIEKARQTDLDNNALLRGLIQMLTESREAANVAASGQRDEQQGEHVDNQRSRRRGTGASDETAGDVQE